MSTSIPRPLLFCAAFFLAAQPILADSKSRDEPTATKDAAATKGAAAPAGNTVKPSPSAPADSGSASKNGKQAPPQAPAKEEKDPRLAKIASDIEKLKQEIAKSEDTATKERRLAAERRTLKHIPEILYREVPQYSYTYTAYGSGVNKQVRQLVGYKREVATDYTSFNQKLEVQALSHDNIVQDSDRLIQQDQGRITLLQADYDKIQGEIDSAAQQNKAAAEPVPPAANAAQAAAEPAKPAVKAVEAPAAPPPPKFVPAWDAPEADAKLDFKDYETVSALVPGRWLVQGDVGLPLALHRVCEKTGEYEDFDANMAPCGKGEWQARGNGMVIFKTSTGKISVFSMGKSNAIVPQDAKAPNNALIRLVEKAPPKP